MRIQRLCLALVTALILASSSGASEIINFDTYPDGSPVPQGYSVYDQWDSLGVVFTMSDSVSPTYANPSSCSRSLPNHVGGDPTVLAWFVDPVTGEPAVTDFVGTAQDLCWYSGEGIWMTAYDLQGNVVAESLNTGSGNVVTFSFPEPIVAMIRMDCIQQGIDDFTFNIPVPPINTGVAQGSASDGEGPAMTSLRVAPNPVRALSVSGVRFSLQHGRRSGVFMHIYDIRGRLVRSLLNGETLGSAAVVEWNGLDDRGVTVAPGVYLVRWEDEDASGTARMTIIR